MALVKLLIFLRGSHLPEARPSSVCLLSAAHSGKPVCKLNVRARTGLPVSQPTPNPPATELPQLLKQRKDDGGPEQGNSFLSQSDLREEKLQLQSPIGRHLGFRLPQWKETQQQ